jgi:DNA polymerase/3'-5' exonuclease PolX
VSTRTPAHIRKFKKINGCGPVKLKLLASIFPTSEDLQRSSLEDFQKLPQVGPDLAAKLYAVKHLPEDQVEEVHNGVPRVPVWNKRFRRKISGAAAPKATELEEWLAYRSATHERYDFRMSNRCSLMSCPTPTRCQRRNSRTIARPTRARTG